jgi:hypothetical protein
VLKVFEVLSSKIVILLVGLKFNPQPKPKRLPNLPVACALNQQMIADAKAALAGSHNAVYTVLCVKGEGWYAIFALPSEFTEVHTSGGMTVYLFNQTAQS